MRLLRPTTSPRVPRSVARRLVGALAMSALLAAAAPPSVAGAHAILESSSPASSSVIPETPTIIELRFNEPVERTLASITLFDERRKPIDIGDTAVDASDSSRVVVEDIPDLDDGVYVVIWRVTSGDGHPVTGAFPFQVGGGATNLQADFIEQLMASLSSRSDLGVPLGVARFLAYAGAIVLIGTVVFTWGSALASHKRAVGTLLASLLAMLIGSGGVLVLQGAYASGQSWGAALDSALVADVVSTRLGVALLARVVLAAAWLVLILLAARAATGRAWMNMTVIASFLTLGTFAVSGHASAGSPAVAHIAVDLVHLSSVAAWAGALPLFALLTGRGAPDVATEGRRFSRIAGRAMPVAIVSGALLAGGLLDGFDALTATDYGRLLLAKVGVVLMVVLAGAAARRRLRGAPGASPRGIVRVEALLVVGVLAVTTFLVGASPNTPTGFKASYGANLAQGDLVVDFQVSPAYVGTVEVHALLSPPGGTLKPVISVEVSLSLPSADVPRIPVRMLELGPNHWSGVVKIPYSGQWRAELRVSPAPNETVLLSTDVPIKD